MMKLKYLPLLTIALSAAPLGLNAEQVRHAATDGMTIELGNYTQQIKVRGKALGAESCNVEFSIQGQTVTLVAPANEYSEWIGVGPTFLGSANEKLGVSVKCNAGAITQVTYFK